MSSRILGADRGLEWHQAVAPVWEVGEIATHGLALSRLKHGFESRWGHHTRPCPSARTYMRRAPEPVAPLPATL